MSECSTIPTDDDGLAVSGRETLVRAAFVAHGRVQGVGFRAFVRREANALGLSGFVRNEGDGSVSGRAEGPESSMEALRAMLERGPSWGRVSRLDWNPLSKGESLPFPFEIRR